MSSYALMGIIPEPGKVIGGDIIFDGEKILEKTEGDLQKIRGKDVGMIFQDPMTSLNPVFTVGHQIEESLKRHTELNKTQRTERIVELLKLVGINQPEKRVKQYPHELSGGMRQRIMIAMSLACNPKLLIADEPTGNLDPATAWEIMNLLDEINKRGTTIVMVTHAKDIVDKMQKRVVTIESGKIVGDCIGKYRVPDSIGIGGERR